MKHTKGKWVLSRGSRNSEYKTNANADLDCIAIDVDDHPGHIMTWGLKDEEHKANAKLIAAAPELLQALQDLMNLMPEGHELRKGFAFDQATKAIKIATQ